MNGYLVDHAGPCRLKRHSLVFLQLLILLASRLTVLASDPIERVERGLLPATIEGASPAPPWTIQDRMRHYRVPGVSVAVIRDFKVEWARGYGVLENGTATPVNQETLFQAASVSKPLAAMGILSLIQAGSLALEDEANRKLRSWRIPDNEFTRVRPVAVGHLLTHTGGINIPGLAGYAPGVPVPTLVQILDGVRPIVNHAPVRVELVPGTQYVYSNGGYIILQQLAIDIAGMEFAPWMQSTVLDKLEMSRSTFVQPLPVSLAPNAASGHRPGGMVLPGKYMTHPEMAAAGLWTTATDLARFVIELQKSYAGKSNRVLSVPTTRSMLTAWAPNYGLGMFIEAEGLLFHHTGSNQGYRSMLLGYTHTGDGAVVLTNSDEAGELRFEIMRSIATEYGWPHFRVAGFPPGAPVLAPSGAVANAASGAPSVAPGSIVSLYGPDLANVTEVVFNGQPAKILAVTPNQINAIVPDGLAPGPAVAQAKRGEIASTGRSLRILPQAPGIFTLNQSGEGPGLVVHAETFKLVTRDEPARRGSYLSVLCTGLGGVQPAVTLGGQPARVLWSGSMPGFPGVDQVNVQVPDNVAAGAPAPLFIRAGAVVSNTVTVEMAE